MTNSVNDLRMGIISLLSDHVPGIKASAVLDISANIAGVFSGLMDDLKESEREVQYLKTCLDNSEAARNILSKEREELRNKLISSDTRLLIEKARNMRDVLHPLWKENKKIQAIKHLRDNTDTGLLECKRTIDDLFDEYTAISNGVACADCVGRFAPDDLKVRVDGQAYHTVCAPDNG